MFWKKKKEQEQATKYILETIVVFKGGGTHAWSSGKGVYYDTQEAARDEKDSPYMRISKWLRKSKSPRFVEIVSSNGATLLDKELVREVHSIVKEVQVDPNELADESE